MRLPVAASRRVHTSSHPEIEGWSGLVLLRNGVLRGDWTWRAMAHERVLVLDDSDEVRAVVAEMIAAYGFLPVEAESAEAALRVAASERPDVAIVDQHLPGASGAKFVQLLRASPDERLRSLPVIGLSGRPWSERELMAAGTCCFVRKPIDVHRLVEAIRWALEVYRPRIETG